MQLVIPGRQRIIVALDVPDFESGKGVIDPLLNKVGAFKIGREAIDSRYGHDLADYLIAQGQRVFWDSKLSDIPNTSEGATRSVQREHPEGIWAANIHASSGHDSIKKMVETAGETRVWAVTLLTSISREQCKEMHDASPEVVVKRWAGIALRQGVSGIICSPQEVRMLREEFGFEFEIVTPGVRSLGVDSHDQARVDTPGNALVNGATFEVLGRQITQAPDPAAAALAVTEELDEAFTVSGFEKYGALRKGHFVLTSKPEGSDLRRHSGNYVNKDDATFSPNFVHGLAILARQRVLDAGIGEPDIIVAAATGAIGFGFALGQVFDCGFVYCEKDESDPDRMVFYRDFARRIQPGMKVLIGEDILTSGGSIKKVIDAVTQLGGEVIGVVLEWQRGNIEIGVPIIALTKRQFPVWSAEECEPCKERNPIDPEPGHGAEFLREQGEDSSNWPANKQH